MKGKPNTRPQKHTKVKKMGSSLFFLFLFLSKRKKRKEKKSSHQFVSPPRANKSQQDNNCQKVLCLSLSPADEHHAVVKQGEGSSNGRYQKIEDKAFRHDKSSGGGLGQKCSFVLVDFSTGGQAYRIISSYTVFRQDRALLKVGRCLESEIGPSNAPVNIITKGRVLGVLYLYFTPQRMS